VIDMGHRPVARTRKVASLLVVAGALALAVPSLAAATTRYAAPGGTAPDTACLTPEMPCSIGTAAGGPDVTAADEAVILPGNYSDADLDGDADQPVDHTVRITAGNVHGETGDRPLINLASDLGFGAFVVHTGTTLSDVEVDAPNSSGVISMTGGVVERIIARTKRDGSVPCEVDVDSVGLLRDSFCFSGGEDSSAVSAEIFNNVGTHTIRLRNVTAVATKPDSDGLFFEGRGAGTTINVDAKSVIARGDKVDVLAEGLSTFDPPLPNTGANVSIALDHSNYVNWSARSDAGGGMAAITPAGTGTNQTGAVVFAADDYHQVAGSGATTIDHGTVDAFSGTTDIDGQSRTIGQAPDIGADELAFPTTTALSCNPNPLQVGMGPTRCEVTVTDASSPPPVRFLSGVRPESELPGTIESSCEELLMATPTQGTCSFLFTPQLAGAQTVSATYPGDANHDSSQGTDSLQVTQPGTGPAMRSAAKKKCKRSQHRRSASAAKKKKCKKKKNRR
jgi:hypothetical protein